MAYLAIQDFKIGMDRRRDRISGQAGALWVGKNGHVNRGGDFERRKKFVAKYELPEGDTQGLAALNEQLYVFGGTTTPAGIPVGVNYQRLQPASGSPSLSRILSQDAFGGALYEVAEFANGEIFHYYDGSRVTAWDTVSAAISGNDAVATALAAKIDLRDDMSASAVGALITMTGDNVDEAFTITKSTVNNGSVNDQDITLTETQTADPTHVEITTAEIIGTFEAADSFTITIEGTDYTVTGAAAGIGLTALTYNQKIYSVTTSLLYFSALNAPTQWGSGTGNGFINMANEKGGNEPLVGAAEYQNKMAIFSRNNIRIWNIDVDPDNNSVDRSVRNSGAISDRSIEPFGNIDLFYLNDSGVRSLRARDSSDAPSVNDVGVTIDPFIVEYMESLPEATVERAVSVIGEEGRYWLAVGQYIFVFSFFPGTKINAWTYYDLSDEIGSGYIDEMVKVGKRVYVRSGDTIYLYGGDDGVTYPDDDEITAEVALPFLSANKPATIKSISGFDIGLTGTWACYLLPDPNREDVELEIGTFNKSTFSQPDIPIEMPTPMFALRLLCDKAGAATVSLLAIHYENE